MVSMVYLFVLSFCVFVGSTVGHVENSVKSKAQRESSFAHLMYLFMKDINDIYDENRALKDNVDTLATQILDLDSKTKDLDSKTKDLDSKTKELESKTEDSCAAVAAKPLPANCNEARLKKPGDPSGEFIIEPTPGVIVIVYCDFLQDHGYMYLSPGALSTLSSLEGLYDITDHAVIRILYTNGEQHDTEVAQISMYTGRYPLSFQLNAHVDYKGPINIAMIPYMFLGFLPTDRASMKSNMTTTPTLQGYKAGGKDIIFTNCDQNPNNYIAFFGNDGQVDEKPYHLTCCNTPQVRAWFEYDQQVPLGSYLPPEYFLFFEMHMGGCGGYFTRSHGVKYGVNGASLGLGFEFKPCTP